MSSDHCGRAHVMTIWQMRLAPACAQVDIRAVGALRSQGSGTLTTGNIDKPSGEGINPKAPSSRLTPISQLSVRHKMRHDHRISPCIRVDIETAAKLSWENFGNIPSLGTPPPKACCLQPFNGCTCNAGGSQNLAERLPRFLLQQTRQPCCVHVCDRSGREVKVRLAQLLYLGRQ